MAEPIASFLTELKVGARSLIRAKGLTVTVVLTLALGIGANSAMFSLVRAVLLRPLVNRDESRLIFIEQRDKEGNNVNFSVPEIDDLRARTRSLSAWGDFSTVPFAIVGLGEPRTIRAGVVGGSYFEVMGLRSVLGRLLDARDDGPNAPGAVVLTYRFWSAALKSDPSVIGKVIRLDSFEDARPATVVGVLEPCVPYPQETEIIANIVTSKHHLSATMQTNRLHRMTDLFARLGPGVNVETARAELQTVYDGMKREHPAEYRGEPQIRAVRLRDQITSGARTILLALLAASMLIFVIACCNVANLILARTIRRETELGIRAALGASSAVLRRTLLTESLVLCAGGAALGALIAQPMVTVLSRYIGRFSIRALDLTVDASVLWVSVGLALVAAVLLAYVPRLPSSGGAAGFGLATRSARVTGYGNRKLRIFAVAQIAASFLLVAAAGATIKTLLALQTARSPFETRQVLHLTVPVMHEGRTQEQIIEYYREAARQIRALPGVQNVAIGSIFPWRDNRLILEFGADGRIPETGHEEHAAIRVISPAFFATLGQPMIEGRDFTDADRGGDDPVAIISLTLAQRMFPNGSALNHTVMWTDPIVKAIPFISAKPLRIIGVVPDMDDMNLIPKPTMTIYRPFDQERAIGGGQVFVHAKYDPHGLIQPVTRILRSMYADQPVERAGTLEEIRADVLSPERLNVIVAAVFAGVALLIAVVGVAGVLAFSVSGRTREFGIRLAVGSQPRNLLLRVMAEGAGMAIVGLAIGLGGGYWLAQFAGSVIGELQMPGALPVVGSATVLLLAAVIASVVPAARAARVDVIQALRTE